MKYHSMIARVFVLGRPVQHILMFVAGQELERCFTQVGSDLTYKHYTILRGLPRATTMIYYELSYITAINCFKAICQDV